MRSAGRTLATVSGVLLASGALWAYRDYRVWLRLGEGGVRAGPAGWLRVTWLRRLMRDPLDLADVRAMQGRNGDIATLQGLPRRTPPRPAVNPQPVPHRQTSQHADDPHRRALRDVFDKAVADHAGTVHYALSHFEKHVNAVTCRDPDQVDPVGGASRGEIAHIHDSDGSMHMILSPSDAIAAIEAGWAQFHGLSGRGFGLPTTYVMVYGPRTEGEVAVVARLLASALAYMCVAGRATA